MIAAPTLTLRPFADADYEATVAIWNRIYPENPETAEGERHFHANLDPRCKEERFVAELDGQVVGVGGYGQNPGMYHPQKFTLTLYVQPERQGQGIGKALYDRTMAALMPHDPMTLRAQAREHHEEAVRFLTARGFKEDKRDWESVLNVTDFDFSPYEGLEERLKQEGVTITTLSELQADPDMPRKFHALFSNVRQDVPRSEPATPIAFEQYYAWTFEAPDYLPAGTFVALDGDDYVGMSQLWKRGTDSGLDTGLTAVKRAYRGRGIALALKLRGIRYALENGAPFLRTDNDSRNGRMLAINERLGFVKEPAWISFVKHL